MLNSKNHGEIKNTKIIATIGPATRTTEALEKLMIAGLNMTRHNFSHDELETHKTNIETVRATASRINKIVGVMCDLQGPKHRIGDFEKGSEYVYKLELGQDFTLDNNPQLGDETRVYLPHPDVLESLKVGDSILVNDGKVELKVKEKSKGKVITTVIRGKEVWSKRAFNIPNTVLNTEMPTEKDKKDLDFIAKLNPDYIAVSFVQTPSDIKAYRDYLSSKTDHPFKVIAKIEKPIAVQNLKAIIDEADAIMVARGDLGVEMPLEDLPATTLKIIKMSRSQFKPVIVATQMLESMIDNAFPFRSEISDIGSAIYNDTDAIMLSAESSIGKYPTECVEIMSKIAVNVENDIRYYRHKRSVSVSEFGEISPDRAFGSITKMISQHPEIKAIVSFSNEGQSASQIASRRPSELKIIVVSDSQTVSQQLGLFRGVIPVVETYANRNVSTLLGRAKDLALENGLVHTGDWILVSIGMGFEGVKTEQHKASSLITLLQI
ncbi:MAG: pyruvate kinase [Alphaproteobacteria bacterium]|nr:pyruvate kinase [Alphaproteobacteria bacterium]